MHLSLHSLSWLDSDQRLLTAHRNLFKQFDIAVAFTDENVRHGVWMDRIMRTTTSDVVGFIDNDCVPLTPGIIAASADYAFRNRSFVGIAQASNDRIPSHIFAAPAFLFVDRRAWEVLGRPSFAENSRSDVAQELSWRADAKRMPYRVYYPTHFEREPVEGVWRLGNYGLYGVGTTFAGGVYHLFQGRYANNVELFEKRCAEAIAGTFDTAGMHRSTDLDYEGKIAPWRRLQPLQQLTTTLTHVARDGETAWRTLKRRYRKKKPVRRPPQPG